MLKTLGEKRRRYPSEGWGDWGLRRLVRCVTGSARGFAL